MLPKAPPEVAIEVVDGDYNVGSGHIHARVLNGPRFHDRARPPRAAMFIHGGGIGSNYTQVERPARWLIARELFDQVILPDRRGSGRSTVLARPFDLTEQADDLRRMLDRMNAGPLTVIGTDIGGPVALVLAGLDPRVTCVALVASGLVRAGPDGITRFLQRAGILRRLLDWELSRSIGRAAPQPANFDPAYDLRSPLEMARFFRTALESIPAERLDSLRYASEAEQDPRAVSVPDGLALDLPILQVIGEGDDLWGGAVPADVQARFPRLVTRRVPGALMHKDVFFKAEAYYRVLFESLPEICPGVQS